MRTRQVLVVMVVGVVLSFHDSVRANSSWADRYDQVVVTTRNLERLAGGLVTELRMAAIGQSDAACLVHEAIAVQSQVCRVGRLAESRCVPAQLVREVRVLSAQFDRLEDKLFRWSPAVNRIPVNAFVGPVGLPCDPRRIRELVRTIDAEIRELDRLVDCLCAIQDSGGGIVRYELGYRGIPSGQSWGYAPYSGYGPAVGYGLAPIGFQHIEIQTRLNPPVAPQPGSRSSGGRSTNSRSAVDLNRLRALGR